MWPDELKDWVQMEGGRWVILRQKRREKGCGKGVRDHLKKLREKTDHVGRVFAGQCACVCESEREKEEQKEFGGGIKAAQFSSCSSQRLTSLSIHSFSRALSTSFLHHHELLRTSGLSHLL